jgi:hypothetical protein
MAFCVFFPPIQQAEMYWSDIKPLKWTGMLEKRKYERYAMSPLRMIVEKNAGRSHQPDLLGK